MKEQNPATIAADAMLKRPIQIQGWEQDAEGKLVPVASRSGWTLRTLVNHAKQDAPVVYIKRQRGKHMILVYVMFRNGDTAYALTTIERWEAFEPLLRQHAVEKMLEEDGVFAPKKKLPRGVPAALRAKALEMLHREKVPVESAVKYLSEHGHSIKPRTVLDWFKNEYGVTLHQYIKSTLDPVSERLRKDIMDKVSRRLNNRESLLAVAGIVNSEISS